MPRSHSGAKALRSGSSASPPNWGGRTNQLTPTRLATMIWCLRPVSLTELLLVLWTPGLGVMMGPEVADGTTEFQPRVQARGGEIGAGARGVGCAGGA